MSYDNQRTVVTLPVNSDQSANFGRFMKGVGVGVEMNDVAGGLCVGVLDSNDANAAGRPAPIVICGVTKVAAGAAVAKWASVQSDVTGRAVVAASGGRPQGMALEAATAAGQIIAVLLRPGQVPLV